MKNFHEEKEKDEKQKSKQSSSWIWEKNEMDRQLKVNNEILIFDTDLGELKLAGVIETGRNV